MRKLIVAVFVNVVVFLCTGNVFSQEPVLVGTLENIDFVIVPIPEAPSSSVEIDFSEYHIFRTDVSDIPYTVSDLSSYDFSSTNYRNGFAFFFKSIDGRYNFSDWPITANVRIFYIVNGTDDIMMQVEDDIVAAIEQNLIVEVDLTLPSARNSLRRGRLDVTDKKIRNLKTGDYITILFDIDGQKLYSAVSHLQSINFHWAFPSILTTNITQLVSGKTTTFFEATPIVTLALGAIYNRSTKSGIGFVGLASADVLWILTRVGEQVQGEDFRKLVESLMFGGALLLKVRHNYLYFGAGAGFLFDESEGSYHGQFNLVAGARIFEILSRVLSPRESK